mmetsp:Transcript_25523/g.65722  ORF Transcript_25523/g.65722 Transcript_25523/m.65722 type:complete len:98 (-) Transcript_25523:753-1046(-)
MAPIISPSASPNSTPTASANLSTLMTKDRETRLVGCSKAFKPKSVFPSVHPFQKPYNAHPNEIITCLDKDTRVHPKHTDFHNENQRVRGGRPFASTA